MLRGMMIMELQRAMFLGQRDVPTTMEIEERAKARASLFLRASKAPPGGGKTVSAPVLFPCRVGTTMCHHP